MTVVSSNQAGTPSLLKPKQWFDIAEGHFGLLYYPGELFDEANRIQTGFLKK